MGCDFLTFGWYFVFIISQQATEYYLFRLNRTCPGCNSVRSRCERGGIEESRNAKEKGEERGMQATDLP